MLYRTPLILKSTFLLVTLASMLAPNFLLAQAPSVSILPSEVSMVVGDTRTLQALNATGQEVQGLTWSSSDQSVATLSTDDPPILTAVGPGQATITAGDGTATVTVYAGAVLPPGTVKWSFPGDGSGVLYMQPVVPSNTSAADVFVIEASGTVQAVRDDGTVAWSAAVDPSAQIIPDFQGGLVVADSYSITKLDGVTGHAYPAYNSPPGSFVLVHPDGTIFTDDHCDHVVGIDPTTGVAKFSAELEHPGDNYCTDEETQNSIIAVDGYAYVPYGYTSQEGNQHLQVLRTDTSGNSSIVPIYEIDWPDPNQGYLGIIYSMISDGEDGVLLSWDLLDQWPNYEWHNHLGKISGTTYTELAYPDQSAIELDLQGQDGTFYGRAFTDTGGSLLCQLIALDGSGNWKWAISGDYFPLYTTADNYVLADDPSGYCSDWIPPNLVTFDSNATILSQAPDTLIPSWTGASYIYTDSGIASVAQPKLQLATFGRSVAWGSLSFGSKADVKQPYYAQLVSCYEDTSVTCPGPREVIWNAYKALAIQNPSNGAAALLVSNASQIQTYVLNKLHKANGDTYQVNDLLVYLRKGFSPYDGPRSTAPKSVLGGPSGGSVKDVFLTAGGANDPNADAATIPGQPHLNTFFNPNNFDSAAFGVNLNDMGMVLHESLHGLTGMSDPQLQTALECSSVTSPPSIDSTNITAYVQQLLATPPTEPGNIQACH